MDTESGLTDYMMWIQVADTGALKILAFDGLHSAQRGRPDGQVRA